METVQASVKSKAITNSNIFVYLDSTSRMYFGSTSLIADHSDEGVEVNVLLKLHEDSSTEYYSLDPTMKLKIKASSLRPAIFEVAQPQL